MYVLLHVRVNHAVRARVRLKKERKKKALQCSVDALSNCGAEIDLVRAALQQQQLVKKEAAACVVHARGIEISQSLHYSVIWRGLLMRQQLA